MGEVPQRYIKNDLEDYATDPEPGWDDERLAVPTRGTVVRALLPEEADVATCSSGGYQGYMGFAIDLDDYVWLIKESYGSCSYCDGFIGCRDDIEYGRSILRNAYCFESYSEAEAFLDEVARADGYYGWSKIASGLQRELDELRDDHDR